MKKVYWIYNENREGITQTPIKAQVISYCRAAAKRTGEELPRVEQLTIDDIEGV